MLHSENELLEAMLARFEQCMTGTTWDTTALDALLADYRKWKDGK